MPQETIGYVELEWTCRNCGTRNAGTKKTCKSCGAAMAEDQEFSLPQDAEVQPVQAPRADRPATPPAAAGATPGTAAPADAAGATSATATPLGVIGTAGVAPPATTSPPGAAGATAPPAPSNAAAAAAPAAPDIHCGFCGTRNLAIAEHCTQCGADLKQGKARRAGKVLGSVGAPAAPQAAGKPATKGMPALGIGCLVLVGVLILAGVVMLALGARTTETVGAVQGVQWERSIAIMEQRAVEREAWRDQLPANAVLGTCVKKERRIQDEPVAGAVKVCGTSYVVDQGTGMGKKVQDCRYRVMEDSCRYTVQEWQVVTQSTARGNDVSPNWPATQLADGQRAGDRSEKYQVTFVANDRTYTYSAPDAGAFARFTQGSKWILRVNSFGAVNEVTPAR